MAPLQKRVTKHHKPTKNAEVTPKAAKTAVPIRKTQRVCGTGVRIRNGYPERVSGTGIRYGYPDPEYPRCGVNYGVSFTYDVPESTVVPTIVTPA